MDIRKDHITYIVQGESDGTTVGDSELPGLGSVDAGDGVNNENGTQQSGVDHEWGRTGSREHR